MSDAATRASVAFTGGLAAAAVKNAAWWGLARHGLAEPYASALAPHLTLVAFAPRLIWGGVWGLAFLIPLRLPSVWLRAIFIAFAVAAVELLYAMPHRSGYGTLGMGLGALAPLCVVAGAMVWAFTAAAWIRLSSA